MLMPTADQPSILDVRDAASQDHRVPPVLPVNPEDQDDPEPTEPQETPESLQ